MATHKDCLYKELCESHNDICVTKNLQDVDKECPNFKSKADFVEVVRCKDCKFSYEHKFFRESYCEKTNLKITQHHFCSYGKRK